MSTEGLEPVVPLNSQKQTFVPLVREMIKRHMSKITELPKAMIWILLKVNNFSGNVLAPLTSQINGHRVNL